MSLIELPSWKIFVVRLLQIFTFVVFSNVYNTRGSCYIVYSNTVYSLHWYCLFLARNKPN